MHAWKGCEDWEDKIEQKIELQKSRERLIRSAIDEAQQRWNESMTTLKDPTIPKTYQMKLDLANECAGLEAKIQQLQKDLEPAEDEEAADEEIQYEIYTILPDLIEEWPNLPFEKRLRFIGALTHKVVISHPAPIWLRIEIHWKKADWGIDIAYIQRRGFSATWTEEEDRSVREMFPTEDAAAILEKLPARTWGAIVTHAKILGVRRPRRRNATTAAMDFENVSILDVQFAKEHRLTLNGKKAQWLRRLISPSSV